ncbi:MAG: glycosyltransferase [Oscillospiraceae bacterium]|nr:glycosyltransferase [Oscillospiraceae bacterium]
MPLVSVIVPVYNVEKYLARCLGSLVNQTLEEIEILVVNDSSPDNSQKIIDDFAAMYPDKIKAFTKPNEGVGQARNFGMVHASAKYIGFVDSDDYVECDMFRDLYENITRNNCQAAVCQFKNYILDDPLGGYLLRGIYPFEENNVYHGRDFLLENRAGVCWNVLWEKTLIDEHLFPGLWTCQDIVWLSVVMSKTERLCYIPRAYYHWSRREGSTTMSKQNIKTLDRVAALEEILRTCDSPEKDAVSFYVIRKILMYIRIYKGFADHFARTIIRHKDTLLQSKYLYDYPDMYHRLLGFIRAEEPIPKVLYYDCFGRNSLTGQEQSCIDSWSEAMIYADGEIICLSEGNCDIKNNSAVSDLYDRGRFDQVGHYFKLKRLYENGGIALGKQMMGQDFLAPMLCCGKAFFAFASDKNIQTGVYASVAGCEIIKGLMNSILSAGQDQVSQDVFNSAILQKHRLAHSYQAVESVVCNDAERANTDRCITIGDNVKIYASGLFTCNFGDGSCIMEDMTFVNPQNPDFTANSVFFTKIQRLYNEEKNALYKKKEAIYRKKENCLLQELGDDRIKFSVQKEKRKKLKQTIEEKNQIIMEQSQKIRVLKTPFYKKTELWRGVRRFFPASPEPTPSPLTPAPEPESASLKLRSLKNFNKLNPLHVKYARFINELPIDDTLTLRQYEETENAEYYKKLATAKYIEKSHTLPPAFVKRTGQIFIDSSGNAAAQEKMDSGKTKVLLYTNGAAGKAFYFAKELAPLFNSGEYELCTILSFSEPDRAAEKSSWLQSLGIRTVIRDSSALVRTKEESYIHTKLRTNRLTPRETEAVAISFEREWRRCFGDEVFDIGICLFDETVSLFWANLFALAPIGKKVICHTYAAGISGQAKKLEHLLAPVDHIFSCVKQLIESIDLERDNNG